MDFLFVILVIMAAIIIANFLSQLMPKSPSFWQILAGIILALIPGTLHQIHLEPDLFLMLVIAPLLFMKGSTQC
ncbi:Uncharacterised protein [Weissella viridescens]|uniref:Sodium, potassium, lithium and rubidium/H(+) antiporter n=1 Tax=Weissella viridescens TaxID=1629 RepID=A0A380P8Z7_WEIVI|nr:Uncharacterised protein [Weissella viridescens]